MSSDFGGKLEQLAEDKVNLGKTCKLNYQDQQPEPKISWYEATVLIH